MNKILPQKYFSSRDTVKIAKSLLGKFLVRRFKIPRKSASGLRKSARYEAVMITEVEAYDGPKDKASHAHRGKTERNKIMFGEAGCWYIYFTYGMHYMLNIVTGPQNYPAAILIRGIKIIDPISRLGGILGQPPLNGPAKLTKYLKIDKKFNGKLANKRTGLWIANGSIKIKPSRIKSAPRVGVDYAGPVWSRKKYRFFIGSG